MPSPLGSVGKSVAAFFRALFDTEPVSKHSHAGHAPAASEPDQALSKNTKDFASTLGTKYSVKASGKTANAVTDSKPVKSPPHRDFALAPRLASVAKFNRPVNLASRSLRRRTPPAGKAIPVREQHHARSMKRSKLVAPLAYPNRKAQMPVGRILHTSKNGAANVIDLRKAAAARSAGSQGLSQAA